MTKIKYVGNRPRVVVGKFMFNGDVRDVSEAQAEALKGTAGIVILKNKSDVQSVPVEKVLQVEEFVLDEVNVEGPVVVVEVRKEEKRAKATSRGSKGRKK